MKIKNAQRSKEHYYISLDSLVSQPIFKNENAYSIPSYPDTGYRLLALFRYWNIIQYYFPFKYLLKENWQNILPEFIPEFIRVKDELEYKRLLIRLITRIHDTHANIWDDPMLEEYKGLNIAPLEIIFIEDQAVVGGFFNSDFATNCLLKRGDIILSINNESVNSILQQKSPYVPASNYPTRLRNIATELLRTNKDHLFIRYQRGEKIRSDTVACYSIKKIGIPQIYFKAKPAYQFLDNNIGYIYPGSTIADSIPDMTDKKGIIIDLRCYPSPYIKGFPRYEQLLPKPIEFATFTHGSIIHPGLFTFSKPIKIGENNNNYYKGKIILLVNEQTQSQAEFLTMIFRAANAKVIGSPTAGTDGNIAEFALPGGVKTTITGLGIYYPDKRETQRIGIIPDIEVKPTLKGIRENRDELLEKAILVILKDEKMNDISITPVSD